MAEYITNGEVVASEIISQRMSDKLQNGYIYFEFSDDVDFATLVIPSAGTVTVNASENGVNFGSIISGNNIDVTSADYDRPSVAGLVRNIKGIPTGIVGATYWRIRIGRFR